MTFERTQPTPFCLEKPSVKNGHFNVLAAFSVRIGLEYGKICKNNDHTCLFHCINTCRVPRKMFEHEADRPRVQTASLGPGNVNA